MNLFEAMKKPFLKQEVRNDTTLTSGLDNIDKILSGDVLDLPSIHSYQYNINRKQKELTSNEKTDSLIKRYRQISLFPEVSSAIEEIVNEAINVGDNGVSAPILTFKDNTTVSKQIQTKIIDEFNNVLGLLNFESIGDELFKQWYEDGKLVSEIIYDSKSTNKGIQDIILLNPIGFRELYDEKTKSKFYTYTKSYSVGILARYNDRTYTPEQIVLSKSGLKYNREFDIGYLYYALKTVTNMNMIEDSMAIYRILRAAESRIWNINVGRMPKQKAETYLSNVINQIKSKLTYNHVTGEVDGQSDIKSLINDYVFPTRGSGESTSVDTIGGDTSFVSSTEDHEMFLKKLYIALKIPVSRLDADNSTMDFTASDILRAEMKFTKYVNKLKRKFGHTYLLEILKLQLISKKVITQNEWKEIKKNILLKWNNSNEILENARLENMKTKAEAFSDLKDSVGKYYSKTYLLKTIMNMTSEEIEEMQKQIKEEEKIFGKDDEDL